MAVEDIGHLVPTKVPAYVDDADIQAALKAYHYGSYDFDTAETDPNNLINPSMAYTITDLQTQIDTNKQTEIDARDISRVSDDAPTASNFSAFDTQIPDGYLWVDKNAPTPAAPYTSTAIYTTTAPTQNLANGLVWVKKGTDPVEAYSYNSETSSWDEFTRGPSGIISVSAPIVNTGTNTQAELELNYGSGLTIESSSLAIDTSIIPTKNLFRRWSGNEATELDIYPRWIINGQTLIPNGFSLYYFTPLVNFTATNISLATKTAATNVSSAKIGIYSVNNITSSLTLVAKTADDILLFSSSDTVYTKTFDTNGGFPSTYSFVGGQTYAVAILVLGQSVNAQLISTSNLQQNIIDKDPKLVGFVTGESDLLTTIGANAVTSASGGIPWIRFE